MDNKERIRLSITAYHLNSTPEQMERSIADIESLFEEVVEPLEVRKERFMDECRSLLKEDRSNAKTLTHFAQYWLEKSARGRKFRFEKEKTFEISKRYANWERNQKKFSVINMLRK